MPAWRVGLRRLQRLVRLPVETSGRGTPSLQGMAGRQSACILPRQSVGFAGSSCSHRNITHADKNVKACACGGLCTVCAAQVMEPVRSRCLCVRVPAPSHMAVQDQLALVAKKEGFSLPGDLGARVAVASARNLRRALLMLEVAYVQHGSPLPEDTKVNPPDWEMYIAVSSPQHGACSWLPLCAAGDGNGRAHASQVSRLSELQHCRRVM